MMKVASHALGCKVNQYESEAIAELFARRGYEVVDIEDCADIYVINTCTVTNFGDKKSRQLIRKVKRQNPASIVAVVGCYAQTAPEEIEGIEGVNLVIGTKGRHEIVDLVEGYQKKDGIVNKVGEIMRERDFEHLSIQTLKDRTRAYLKIQDGCSQFCSYCIIPYARGPIRSREPEDILQEVQSLAAHGFQEIILTGIHVASYGKDLKDIDLLEIIKRVAQVEGIRRIRLSSIEPNIITEEFMDALSQIDKVCHHFHLSLQSGCNKTLRAMNRKYTTEKYFEAVQIIRRYWKDAALTTDIIVGFPGESEADFEESCAFAKKVWFSKIHVFPYSPKKGTPAAGMDNQLSNAVKASRSKALIALSEADNIRFRTQYKDKILSVLFEREVEKGVYEGHTSNYITVRTKSDTDLKNKIFPVRILKVEDEYTVGNIAE